MFSLAVTPRKFSSLHLRQIPDLVLEGKDEILLKGIRTGICGTDLEINEGLYGEPPRGSDFLILGHESFAKVARVSGSHSRVKVGDLVVRTVRRPCPACRSCQQGRSDQCLTGDFLECGIKGLHGSLAEYYLENEAHLLTLPLSLEPVGVLTEPLSFAHKITRRAKIFLQDLWPPKKALVIGCGAIGIFQTLILRSLGSEVTVVARSPRGNQKSEIVEKTGAFYYSVKDKSLKDVLGDRFQAGLIVEASGHAERVPEAMGLLDKCGVLCLSSITGGHSQIPTSWDTLNIDLVLGNKIVVGVVNSNREDFQEAVKLLEHFDRLWPGLVGRMITKKVNFETFAHAFERGSQDIKVTIEIP